MVRADTDAVPTSVRRFMARARRRRLRAALPWAVSAGVVLVVGALVWMVYGTSVLGVRSVDVVGTESLSALQVEQAAAVRMDQPLAGADLDRIRGRVEALPPVDRAIVSRSWPSTIVIEVVERSPVAAVPAGEEFTLIDAEGVAYRTVSKRPSGLPVAKLAAPSPEDINTRSALIVLSALTAELRDQLVSISVPAPAQVSLGLRKDRTVIWGDDTQSENKARVATALLERKGDTIDVSAPDVVTIR
ncbi:putative cell division protein FtsQ [Actinoplanes friuliensis DSM 7358]|uniref:Putative cell division protein FtsQ n=1 Tax=Actinoplanes friuliensis DSM 7358 TaxID=1246995 RepID=U5VTH4_9ACTN|nr:putative cell division protein FtsQ [Actinoplanes friuliensis DSM 7358]